MNRLLVLVKGELSRQNKYNMTTISIVVALIWFGLLYFIEGDLFKTFIPFVIFIDSTQMAILFVGAVMFYEKTESTISTLLVTPVSKKELILSKVIANTLHTIFSVGLIVVALVLVKDVSINFLLLLVGVLVATAFHTLVGIVLSYFSKDFTVLLINMMIYAFALMIPTILFLFGVIGEEWDVLLKFAPTQASLVLIDAAFKTPDMFDYWFSLLYLIIFGVLGFYFYVLPKFQEYSVKQSGV